MKIKRIYSEFISIVSSRGLQIILGETRVDAYHLLALDGQLTYECFLSKDGGADQLDFENNYLSGVSLKLQNDPDWDDIQTTKPTLTTLLHSYYKNSVLVMTVLATYETSSRKDLIRVQKTRL